MQNIFKIISLIVAVVSGIITVLLGMFTYEYLSMYNELGEFVDFATIFSSHEKDILVLIISTIFSLVLTLTASYIFWRLHKNKQKIQNNTTLLDYDNTNE